MLTLLDLPVPLDTAAPLTLRRAVPEDLGALMRLLSDDPVSSSRGDVADPSDTERYAAALRAILEDAGNDLVVVTDEDEAVATMQLTLIPGMARQGSSRLLIEAVRVASDRRSSGIGAAMMRWAMHTAAPALEANLVQLTSDAQRSDAHRFYTRLGFADSHVGFKYHVPTA